MPNIKSAKKELKKSARRREFNNKIKAELKRGLKNSQRAIAAKDEKAGEILALTLKKIDKAAQKGIIKKNTRDRKKSRLQKKFNTAFKTE